MTITHAQLKRFTIDEYYQMFESGLFQGQKVELIEGEVVLMSPHNIAHGRCMSLMNSLLVAAYPAHVVRVQLPFEVSDRSEPEPDFAIVTRDALFSCQRHPTEAILLIEVSDSSLAYDQDEKASLYALAGVPEYWIVNLRGRQVEVHRQPRAGRYTEVVALGIDDHVTPLISVQQIFEGI